MKLFIIKHTKTGNYLPQSYLKGGTYWHGDKDDKNSPPRTFHSRAAANAFIYAWEKGLAKVEYGRSDVPNGVYYEDQNRSRDDLKVIECELIPKEGS